MVSFSAMWRQLLLLFVDVVSGLLLLSFRLLLSVSLTWDSVCYVVVR